MSSLLSLLVALALLAPPPAQAQPQPQPAADQAAALRPEFQGDMARAGEWNRYTIVAAVEPQRQSISGTLTLDYTNRDSVPLGAISFHLFPNLRDFAGRIDVTSVAVGGARRPVAYERSRSVLRVDLPAEIAPGESARVELGFRTVTPANAARRYYGAFNLQNSVLTLASSFPIAAIVRGGAWDVGALDTRGDLVNSETALFDVTLTAPAGWTLITTGVAVSSSEAGGRQTRRFVSGPQRDFMIAAARLGVVSGTVGGTKVNAYYRPGSEAGGQAVLRIATGALQVYGDRFGPYPLAELDIVPVDAGTFLGVEYPGMVLIEQRLYRGSPGLLESTVAHEVAHQWWYSLVGNDVQTEAWLDEALATYSQVIYAEAIKGRAAADAQLETFRGSYRAVRAAGRDAAIAQPSRAIRSYYPVVYSKGALFFEALRRQVGEEAFARFLRAYYADHRYGIVTGADLLASAQSACACDLGPLYRDWITTAAPVAIP